MESSAGGPDEGPRSTLHAGLYVAVKGSTGSLSPSSGDTPPSPALPLPSCVSPGGAFDDVPIHSSE
jgi:hypothetical protein